MTDTTKPKRARRFARTPETRAAAPVDQKGTAPKDAAPADSARRPIAKAESKTGRVIALLQRPEGATLKDIIAATGWLPHTTRAALTGLMKKGHTITRDRRGEAICYHTGDAA